METIQPKLRFPEFKGDWERKTLGDIFSILNGYAFSSSDSIDDGVLWVKIADIGIQEMKKDNLSFLPNEYIEKHKKFILKKDDYVIALTRPILNGKLKIAKINDFFNGSLLNQRVGKLITSHNSTFVFNILQKDLIIKSIENNISGSDPPNLSPIEISFIETFIPSVEEQAKIANFLSAVDVKINLLKEKKSLLEDYKKGIMQKIFNQEIKFKDDNGNNFEDWIERKLCDVGEFKNGINKGKEDFGFGVPFINLMDVFGKSTISNLNLDLVNANEKEITLYELKKGDVLFIRSSVKKSGIGETSVILNDLKNTVYSGFLIRFRDTKIKLDLNFKIYCFANVDFRENLISMSTTSANTNINQESLNELYLNIPPLKEQIKIANFLLAIDEKITLVSNQIQDTQEYKKGLLQQMFV